MLLSFKIFSSLNKRSLDNKGKIKGEYVFTGVMPKFLEKFKERGINISPGSFTELATMYFTN